MNSPNTEAESLEKASFKKMQEEGNKAWKSVQYIPKEFYDRCYSFAFIHKQALDRWEKKIRECSKHENPMLEKLSNELNKGMLEFETFRWKYNYNLISDHPFLKEFYIENSDKSDFLTAIRVAFERTALFIQTPKNTEKDNWRCAMKLIKLFDKVHVLLGNPDLSFDVQQKFESLLVKHFKKHFGLNYLYDYQVIPLEMRIRIPITIDTTELNLGLFLREIATYLYEGLSEYKTRKFPIKKINSKSALTNYAVKVLKEVMVKHKISTRKHVKYITNLVDVVMEDHKIDEDKVRKLLK